MISDKDYYNKVMKTNCTNKVKAKFMAIKELTPNKSCKNYTLILDENTLKTLEKFVSMNDILSLKFKSITQVQECDKYIIENQGCGIYYLKPESIKYMLKHYQNNKRIPYLSINILISEAISEELMKKIASQNNIIERLASFGQLILQHHYVNESIMRIDHKVTAKNIAEFNSKTQIDIDMHKLAAKISNGIMASFGDNLTIKIYYASTSSFSTTLAQKIFSLFESRKKYLQSEVVSSKPQIPHCLNILVSDRSCDAVSPLMHSFVYLPLLIDSFDIESYQPFEIKIAEGSQKISMNQKITMQYGLRHINAVLQTINDDLKQYKKTNETAKFQQNNHSNLKNVMKQLPQFKQTVASYTSHISILEQLLKILKQQPGNKHPSKILTQLCQLQYTIITNINSKGQTQKDKSILSKSNALLSKLSTFNQYRLISILLLCIDMSSNDYANFLKKLKESKLVNFIAYIQNIRKPTQSPFKLPFNKAFHQEKNIYLNRHQPRLFQMLMAITHNQKQAYKQLPVIKLLSENTFHSKLKPPKQQWVVVQMGGICFHEIAMLNRASPSPNTLHIITDTIYNAQQYINENN